MARWTYATMGTTMHLHGDLDDELAGRVEAILDDLAPTAEGAPPDVVRVVRAVAMRRAASVLGSGDWYLSLGDEVQVNGSQGGRPWIVSGEPVTHAAARAGDRLILADDIVSATVQAITG